MSSVVELGAQFRSVGLPRAGMKQARSYSQISIARIEVPRNGGRVKGVEDGARSERGAGRGMLADDVRDIERPVCGLLGCWAEESQPSQSNSGPGSKDTHQSCARGVSSIRVGETDPECGYFKRDSRLEGRAPPSASHEFHGDSKDRELMRTRAQLSRVREQCSITQLVLGRVSKSQARGGLSGSAALDPLAQKQEMGSGEHSQRIAASIIKGIDDALPRIEFSERYVAQARNIQYLKSGTRTPNEAKTPTQSAKAAAPPEHIRVVEDSDTHLMVPARKAINRELVGRGALHEPLRRVGHEAVYWPRSPARLDGIRIALATDSERPWCGKKAFRSAGNGGDMYLEHADAICRREVQGAQLRIYRSTEARRQIALSAGGEGCVVSQSSVRSEAHGVGDRRHVAESSHASGYGRAVAVVIGFPIAIRIAGRVGLRLVSTVRLAEMQTKQAARTKKFRRSICVFRPESKDSRYNPPRKQFRSKISIAGTWRASAREYFALEDTRRTR
ncbi:hypothetical protein FB451DRAFT_1443403 [Mycena latifolia]|nr:hypothetical protein FB451DRAFT_1443403 [Mycena latifolia]